MLSLTISLLLLITSTTPKKQPPFIQNYWHSTYATDNVPDYWNHGPIYVPGLPIGRQSERVPPWLSNIESSSAATTETLPVDIVTENQASVVIEPITTTPTYTECDGCNTNTTDTTITPEYDQTVTTIPERTKQITASLSTVALDTSIYGDEEPMEITQQSTVTDDTNYNDYKTEQTTKITAQQSTNTLDIYNDDEEPEPASRKMIQQYSATDNTNYDDYKTEQRTKITAQLSTNTLDIYYDDEEPDPASREITQQSTATDTHYDDYKTEQTTEITAQLSTVALETTNNVYETTPVIITQYETSPKENANYDDYEDTRMVPQSTAKENTNYDDYEVTRMVPQSTAAIDKANYDAYDGDPKIEMVQSTLTADGENNDYDKVMRTRMESSEMSTTEMIQSSTTETTQSSTDAYLEQAQPVIRALEREPSTDPFSVFLRKILILISAKKVEDLPTLVNQFKEYISMLLTSGQLGIMGLQINSYIATRLLILDNYPMGALRDFCDKIQKSLTLRSKKLPKDINDILDYMDDIYDEAEEEAMQAVLREVARYPNTKNYNKVAQGLVDYVFLKPIQRVAGTTRGKMLLNMIIKAIVNRNRLK